ncbi:MAG TPA: exosortase/archaeosortase family protein [Methylophilaceae bacterium]|nr:exosortase/archaeosortase family protein [Methylophilaceae bacterium]
MYVKSTHTQHWVVGGLLVSTLLASWPQWLWLARRNSDGSDDPWGVVAMLTIIALVYADKDQLQVPKASALSVTALLAITASAAWGGLPPILSTAIALMACTWLIAHMLPKTRALSPLLALAMLALPLVASLNFYLGYPLRWFCAHSTSVLLSAFGTVTSPEGASLWWNGKTILIDAPCAGIAMLWIGLYLGALFSYLNSAQTLRTLINLSMAGALVILANVIRNTLLFYKESGMLDLPHWTHEAIGLVTFALFVPCVYFVCHAQFSFKRSTP